MRAVRTAYPGPLCSLTLAPTGRYPLLGLPAPILPRHRGGAPAQVSQAFLVPGAMDVLERTLVALTGRFRTSRGSQLASAHHPAGRAHRRGLRDLPRPGRAAARYRHEGDGGRRGDDLR